MNARKYRLRGAVVAGSLLSVAAHAGDLTVSSARTTPAATSSADGAGPGNVTVATGGSIAVTTGAAVTVDSSNSVTNAGTVSNSGESSAIGIRAATGNGTLTGAITTGGSINLPGPAATSSLYTASVLNAGIQVDGAGVFRGAITQSTSGVMTVGGNASSGIAVNARIDGSLVNAGRITMSGNSAWGISTTAAVSGALTNSGTIEGPGQASIGLYAGGGVGGVIANFGKITTGTAAGSSVSTNPLLPGGRALWIAGNAGGILLEGDGITAAQATAGMVGNGLTDSSLTVTGGAEALYVGPGGLAGYQDTVIGAGADAAGSSLLIRGTVSSTSASMVSSVRAINITGTSLGGVDYHTTFTGAFRNLGGNITADGVDSPVNAIRIGELATVPAFINTGDVLARAKDSSEDATTGAPGAGGGDATALLIDARGSLTSLTNSGNITADSHGLVQNAYGVIDMSGTLTSVENTGSVSATVHGSGAHFAFDLSHGSAPITFRNSGSIIGDIALGAGNDDFSSTGGGIMGALTLGAGDDRAVISNTTLTGAIDLGDGANTLSLTNSSFTGGILSGAGASTVTFSATQIVVPAGSTLHFTDGRIGGGSTVSFNISTTLTTTSIIKADGALVVESGTAITTSLTGPVSDHLTVNLMEAGALTMSADLTQMQPASTVMYAKRIAFAADNPNVLQLQVDRNTASQIGLSQTLGKVYEASVSALATDTELAGALGGMTSRGDFESALDQMLPDTTDAMRMAELQGQNLAQATIRRRLDGLLRDIEDPFGRHRTSYWAQTYGGYATQSAQAGAPGYRIITGGLAGGMDGELSRESIGGFSVSQTESYIKEQDVARSGDLSTTALNMYARFNAEPAYLQAIVGFGYNSHSSKRSVAIADIARTAVSDWTGNQLNTTLDAGTSFGVGAARLTTYVRSAYARIFEQAHTETGGGDGIDLTYASHVNTSLRAGGGAIAQYQVELGDFSVIEAEARGDYAHEFRTGAALIQTRFAVGTTSFTMLGPTGASAILTGGAGLSWKQKFSALSLDYDAEKAGGFLGHTLTLTYRQRF